MANRRGGIECVGGGRGRVHTQSDWPEAALID